MEKIKSGTASIRVPTVRAVQRVWISQPHKGRLHKTHVAVANRARVHTNTHTHTHTRVARISNKMQMGWPENMMHIYRQSFELWYN